MTDLQNLVNDVQSRNELDELLETLCTRYEFYYQTVESGLANEKQAARIFYPDTAEAFIFYEFEIDKAAWGGRPGDAYMALVVLHYCRGHLQDIYVSRETDHDDVASYTMPY